MNDKEIINRFTKIVDSTRLNESIGSGLADIIIQRLTKTQIMVDNLKKELVTDEAINTIQELSDLSVILGNAIQQAHTIVLSLHDETSSHNNNIYRKRIEMFDGNILILPKFLINKANAINKALDDRALELFYMDHEDEIEFSY